MPGRTYLPMLAATFVVATAGLVYELIAGTVSSYLLGDSVYQFSLVIGLFMSAMGIGAFLSRHVVALEPAFVWTQLALGLVGGCSALLLFNAFALIDNYAGFLLLLCVVTGTLVGLEIPLILRILERHETLRLNVSNILTADYIGALLAALLFPLVLVPQLGLIQTGLVFGLLNLATGLLGALLFGLARLLLPLAIAAAVLVGALAWADPLTTFLEARLFDSEVILAQTTPYQRLVVTREGERYQLFLNGNLQFDTIDEQRYHESLVHPIMSLAVRRANVLILGGGDGMAAREVERYADVERITLVDLDPSMTGLFRDHPMLSRLNAGSLSDARLEIVNNDAWKFLEATDSLFDVVILDLPDPHDLSLSRLYSREFYAEVVRHLPQDGLLVTQATSPLFAREAFWCIERTLAETPDPFALDDDLTTLPYHAYVPSFGEWGFVIAGARVPRVPLHPLPAGLRFLEAPMLEAMQQFPQDMSRLPVEANSIMEHPLVAYHEAGWARWFR